MAKKSGPLKPSEHGSDDFVPAVFARSAAEAERFRELLDDHDIPAVVATDDEISGSEDSEHRAARLGGMTQGVAVLVPEVLLDEASQVIADFEDSDDYQAASDEFDEDEEEEEEELGLKEEVAEEELTSSQDEGDETLDDADVEDDFDPDEL